MGHETTTLFSNWPVAVTGLLTLAGMVYTARVGAASQQAGRRIEESKIEKEREHASVGDLREDYKRVKAERDEAQAWREKHDSEWEEVGVTCTQALSRYKRKNRLSGDRRI